MYIKHIIGMLCIAYIYTFRYIYIIYIYVYYLYTNSNIQYAYVIVSLRCQIAWRQSVNELVAEYLTATEK